MLALLTLGAVFILIAIRRIGSFSLQIWQIMLLGAVMVLITGQISPADALRAVNLEIILFLFGVFTIGQALEESGYLSQLAAALFGRAKSVDQLVLAILLGFGLLSTLLMNDTMAIIGTPVVLLLARQHGLAAKPLLMTLAFAITIGSVMSPIGNPQNLLIAVTLTNPFITFFRHLAVPTLINLLVAYLVLKYAFRTELAGRPLLISSPDVIKDYKLARLAQVSLALMLILIAAKIALGFTHLPIDLRLTDIALIAAVPVLLSEKRVKLIREIDWYTLIFFIALFILMQSVWDSGVFQSLLAHFQLDITTPPVIMTISVLLSQLISNVPLVALYLPLLIHAGATPEGLLALAAGSTIAGNLLILGAASNVIIIQHAERSGETLSFVEFAKVGIPLASVNILVYALVLL
ncbi:MAG TPA: anion transporter [Methanomicrobia archaeon]|nr:anion transporter [Methanomicrobia archaeon]